MQWAIIDYFIGFLMEFTPGEAMALGARLACSLSCSCLCAAVPGPLLAATRPLRTWPQRRPCHLPMIAC